MNLNTPCSPYVRAGVAVGISAHFALLAILYAVLVSKPIVLVPLALWVVGIVCAELYCRQDTAEEQ